MIGDIITDCARCGERPERRDIVTVGAGAWWLVVCCRPRLVHVIGEIAPEPEEPPPLATRRDLLRTQGAILRLEERLERLEARG